MKKTFRKPWWALLLLAVVSVSPARGERTPVKLESDRLDYYEETGIIEGRGNVRVRRGDMQLAADFVVFNSITGFLFAEGDVFFSGPGGDFSASSLEYDFHEESAAAVSAESFVEPWFLSAEEFEQVSPEKQVLSRTSATTCDSAVPHYRFTARSMEVEPGVALRARHAVFFIGRVPVFYLPYYRRSLRDVDSGYTLRPGYSSQRGVFAMSYYSWHISPGFRGRWHLDYYRKLGWGKGFDINVEHGSAERPGSGFLYLYHIDEKGSPREGAEPDERWKIHLRHGQRFSDDVRSILRMDILSDADFNRDYLTDETLRFLSRPALEAHRPEGSLSITALKPDYSAELYTRKRVNDFTTVTENLPRASLRLTERSIGDGLYFNFDADIARLNLSSSEEEQSLTQARMRPGISRQSRLWFLRMNPSIAGEGFWYGENMEGDKNIFQGSYEFDMPVSLANGVWRIYDTPGWEGFEKARHLMIPRLTYSYRPEPGEGREDIYHFADRIPGKKESVRAELRNTIEGRRPDGSKFRFLDLDFYSDYDMLEKEERWGNIHADLRAYSTRALSLRKRASFNPYTGKPESLNGDILLRRLGWDFETGYRFYEPGGEKHTFELLGRAHGPLGGKWGLDLQGRYDVHEDELIAARIGVTRDLHCWEMQVFWQEEKEESRVMVAFRIKGIPGASLDNPF